MQDSEINLDANVLVGLLQTGRADGRTPLSGTLELTPRCNLTCQHCYINEPAHDRAVRAKEMTTDDYKRVLEELAAQGTLYLTLTGGEILLRPDFREIYLHALQQGLFVTLFTNATLVTPKIADFLAEYPPRGIEISIYGYTEETYEKVTGIRGSYAKFRRGVQLLHERGLEVVLKTVIMTINQHEYADMKAFAGRLGMKFGHDTAIFARMDGGKQPCAVRVEAERVVEIDLSDPQRSCEMIEAYGQQATHVDTDNLYRCGAGKNTFHISSTGHVAACTISKVVGQSLKETSFQETWDGPIKEMVSQKKSDVFTKCKTCQVKEFCTICPAKAILESNNPEFQIDYFCTVAELRAKTFSGKNTVLSVV